MKTYKLSELFDKRKEIADEAIKCGATCDQPQKLKDATTPEEAFVVVLDDYNWLLKNTSIRFSVLDNLTREQLSPWWIWLLETHSLGKEVDYVVQPIIDLHKRVVAGDLPAESEWSAAWSAAKSAPNDVANFATRDMTWEFAIKSEDWDEAWEAAWDAASPAAWSTAQDMAWEAASHGARDGALDKLYYHLLTLEQ